MLAAAQREKMGSLGKIRALRFGRLQNNIEGYRGRSSKNNH
jgi:hypothetical protein